MRRHDANSPTVRVRSGCLILFDVFLFAGRRGNHGDGAGLSMTVKVLPWPA